MKNEMSSVAMYTEWHFPYWGRGKGSHIGVVVRAWVLPRMRSGFQSSLGTSIHYIHKKKKAGYDNSKWGRKPVKQAIPSL